MRALEFDQCCARLTAARTREFQSIGGLVRIGADLSGLRQCGSQRRLCRPESVFELLLSGQTVFCGCYVALSIASSTSRP
jgi:hypothetical protein